MGGVWMDDELLADWPNGADFTALLPLKGLPLPKETSLAGCDLVYMRES
jgi:hypothetical protein